MVVVNKDVDGSIQVSTGQANLSALAEEIVENFAVVKLSIGETS